jgi:hypothetical protein
MWTMVGFMCLVTLCLPASLITKIKPPSGSEPFGSSEALILFLLPSISIVVAGMLLYAGQNLHQEREKTSTQEEEATNRSRPTAGKAAFTLLLGVLLLAKAVHSVYWLTVWDKTTDSLGYFWLAFPILAALLAGLILIYLLSGWKKLLGSLYIPIVSVMLVASSASAQRVNIHQLTLQRAERVNQAIEGYHTQEGRYPQNLRQLTPRYALTLPEPVTIFAQGWCYDGGEAYYRLGYLDRLHWSDPRLIGRVYKTAGELPDLHPMCEAEANALIGRAPRSPYKYWMESE